MQLDKFSNLIYSETDLTELLYQNCAINQVYVTDTDVIRQFERLANIALLKVDPALYEVSIEDFDSACQSDWLISDEYKTFDVATFCLEQCTNQQEVDRVLEELVAFEQRNLMMLLRTMKYIVDTLRNNQIFWGVGRGSSVASFVLYLLGVHKINSLKYGLNWQEFLR